MDDSNMNKSLSGKKTKEALKKLLKNIEDDTKLSRYLNVEVDFKTGAVNKDPKQFIADAKIVFKDDEAWFIKVSSSYRSDRIKGNEFDMEHILEIQKNRFNYQNIKCYFVIPYSSKKEMDLLKTFSNEIKSNSIVTSFSDAYILMEFANKLLAKCTEKVNPGIKANILGPYAEKQVIYAFSNNDNIKIWNNYIDSKANSEIKSYDYPIVRNILESNHIKNKIKTVSQIKCGTVSTDSSYYSPQLGHADQGMPKTDVYIKLLLEDNTEKNINISVKFPQNPKTPTTVHQGNVKNLINDLSRSKNLDNNLKHLIPGLKLALEDFQNNGSFKLMSNDNKIFLSKNLSKFNKWLIEFFVFGIDNNNLHGIQIANTLVIFNPENGSVKSYDINDVYNNLMSNVKNYSPNIKEPTKQSPFSWTYPSGHRGNAIQLKTKLNPFV